MRYSWSPLGKTFSLKSIKNYISGSHTQSWEFCTLAVSPQEFARREKPLSAIKPKRRISLSIFSLNREARKKSHKAAAICSEEERILCARRRRMKVSLVRELSKGLRLLGAEARFTNSLSVRRRFFFILS